ncbi:3-oxoacyl-[acyl-carrier protein] reductase, partial [hydrothermal vent metagenome]
MSGDTEIALVTGASRGIGKAIVLALAAENRVIAGTATTESGAEKITNYMKEAGIVGRGYVLNVTDQS